MEFAKEQQHETSQNYHHNVYQLERLSYILDKVQENTMAYQAEAAFNSNMYLHLFKLVIFISAIKDIAGLIISNNSIANSETQKYALLGTSIIGIIMASINVIAGAYEYQVKKQQFSAAVEQFDILEDRIRFEMINPDENFNNFCQQLENNIESIKSQCKYQPSLENKSRYRKKSNRPHEAIPTNSIQQQRINQHILKSNMQNQHTTALNNGVNNTSNNDIYNYSNSNPYPNRSNFIKNTIAALNEVEDNTDREHMNNYGNLLNFTEPNIIDEEKNNHSQDEPKHNDNTNAIISINSDYLDSFSSEEV